MATLSIYPLANRPGSLPGTRQLISQGHKVVYEIEPGPTGDAEAGDVIILRIFGPGQSDT